MPSMFDELEPRRMFATIDLSDTGVLTVLGTRGNDEIIMYSIKDSYALRIGGRVVAAYKKSAITEVRMYGFDGNDDLRAVTICPVLLVGGEGNDSLKTGRANDTLIGGNGNDRLDAGGGSDILRGDNGNDTLSAGAGDDFIYGGLDVADSRGNPAVNIVSGGAGNDTAINSVGAVDRRTNIESVQPESFRPAGRGFPETISFVAPANSIIIDGRSVLASVTYTVPNPGVLVLFATEARRSTTRSVFQLPAVVLNDSVGRAPSPQTLGTSIQIDRIPPGDYSFVLGGSEGLIGRVLFSIAPVTGT